MRSVVRCGIICTVVEIVKIWACVRPSVREFITAGGQTVRPSVRCVCCGCDVRVSVVSVVSGGLRRLENI